MYQAIQKTQKILQVLQVIGLLFLVSCSAAQLLEESKKAAHFGARALRIDEETRLKEDALEAKYQAKHQEDRAEDLEQDLRMERRLDAIRQQESVRQQQEESSSWLCLGIFC